MTKKDKGASCCEVFTMLVVLGLIAGVAALLTTDAGRKYTERQTTVQLIICMEGSLYEVRDDKAVKVIGTAGIGIECSLDKRPSAR